MDKESLCIFMSRHEHGQKFALEAEVEIETEKKFLPRLGLRLKLTCKDPNELNRDWGGLQKKQVSCEPRLKLLSNSSRG